MTLTTHRPVREATKPSRPVVSPAPQPAHSLAATPVLTDVYRVTADDLILGYVQVVGPVFVTLKGTVYDTSVEIAQCRDLEAAIARLSA